MADRASARNRAREFFATYTRDLKADDVRKLLLRETPEAYQFFARGIDQTALALLPWHKKALAYTKLLFLAFTMRLSPARRALFGVALVLALIGLLRLFRGIGTVAIPVVPPIVWVPMPGPVWEPGTLWLFGGFLVLNLLVLLEVADRLSLKRDLEVAREIQIAMLPRETFIAEGIEAFGLTRPANTVGGDLYDVLVKPDGRVVVCLGDVAGKGSPAALLMALVVAMLRALVDEGLEAAELAVRLNAQVCRHAPGSRFVTLFLGVYNPVSGEMAYVNAGQNPPLLRRESGAWERLTEGGIALGLFDHATYTAGLTSLERGDVLVMYSDGITEAEDGMERPFEETGLQDVIGRHWWQDLATLGTSVLKAVEAHAGDVKLADDLTVLAVRRPIPLPGSTAAQ